MSTNKTTESCFDEDPTSSIANNHQNRNIEIDGTDFSTPTPTPDVPGLPSNFTITPINTQTSSTDLYGDESGSSKTKSNPPIIIIRSGAKDPKASEALPSNPNQSSPAPVRTEDNTTNN